MLFGIYSIANLSLVPMRLSTTALTRLGLSMLSYLAIFPTESRASMVMTTIILALYLAIFGVGIMVKGRISPAGLILTIFVGLGFVFVVMILLDAGYFEKMLIRFQYDYGSALSRNYAIDILQSVSDFGLWFGLSQTELNTIQAGYGLIAIEIAWVNFIFVGGLITTIPLLVTLCLFLFRSLPRYCYFGIYFVSLLILESTFASNSIWSKTTVVTNSLIVGISMLRRIDLSKQVIADRASGLVQRRPRSQSHGS